MSQRTLTQFKNYIDTANRVTNTNTGIYFFLKGYAFYRVRTSILENQLEITESDKAAIDSMEVKYQQEVKFCEYNQNLSREEFYAFLEKFYEMVDFDNADQSQIYLCKDLTEVLFFFGDLDDLSARRMDYFAKRVQSIDPNKLQVEKSDKINYLVSFYETSKPQNSTAKQNTKPNVFPPKTNANTIPAQSKSLEDFPDVVSDEKFNYTRIESMSNQSYIPRLVDKSVKLPIKKNSDLYKKVKEIIKTHIEYSSLELDFHKLEYAKDHAEAAIYYLRNIEE